MAGLVKALADAFASDGGQRTRRFLAAALGELLFYIASQVQMRSVCVHYRPLSLLPCCTAFEHVSQLLSCQAHPLQ